MNENGERDKMLTITFGSNKFINSNGLVVYRLNGKDKELLKYELREGDSKPLLTIEIRDNIGTLLGKVYKSTSFLHVDPMFDGEVVCEGSEVKKMVLRRKKDYKKFFELIVHSSNDIEVNGIFYLEGNPYPIIATSDGLTVGRGNVLSHCTMENCGKAIYLS
jgi:hypothetical protein